jgi:hypothetical protein
MTQIKKIKKEVSHFVLSHEEKVALMEAKIQRAEAHVQALAELAKLKTSARRSKYPPR